MEKRREKNDLLHFAMWFLVLLVWILILTIPTTREKFEELTMAHPYIMGFFKFFILGTMGDILGTRILRGYFSWPKNMVKKAIVWGTIGMMITILFPVFNNGAKLAMEKGLLPFSGNAFFTAFFSSALMNLVYGPTMYAYHKLMDLFIDLRSGRRETNLKDVVSKTDWYSLVSFSWLFTLPLIWIPLHTMVFLLPANYRIVASAFLGIVLGVLVALSKKKK